MGYRKYDSKLDIRKYNNQTDCFKIDIYASIKNKNHFIYVASTDQSKTLKEAKEKYILKNQEFCKDKDIHCNYDRS